MKPFRRVTGRAAVLDRADVDTDQIMPKQFLKRIERTGYGEFIFYDWAREPRFELNRPAFAGAKILLTGRNFGCGSSREHAPWGLQEYGFQVLIAPSFGDIFASNCVKIGLVPVTLPAERVRALMDAVDSERGAELTVDLESLAITGPAGETISFEFDPFHRECLLNGLDDIARALGHEDEIAAFESRRPSLVDTTAA